MSHTLIEHYEIKDYFGKIIVTLKNNFALQILSIFREYLINSIHCHIKVCDIGYPSATTILVGTIAVNLYVGSVKLLHIIKIMTPEN